MSMTCRAARSEQVTTRRDIAGGMRGCGCYDQTAQQNGRNDRAPSVRRRTSCPHITKASLHCEPVHLCGGSITAPKWELYLPMPDSQSRYLHAVYEWRGSVLLHGSVSGLRNPTLFYQPILPFPAIHRGWRSRCVGAVTGQRAQRYPRVDNNYASTALWMRPDRPHGAHDKQKAYRVE